MSHPSRSQRTAVLLTCLAAALLTGACSSSGDKPAADAQIEIDAPVPADAGRDSTATPASDEGSDNSPLLEDTRSASDAKDDAPGDTEANTPDSAAADSPVDIPEPLPAEPPGPGFHRDGGYFNDELGRALVLHGINVSNYTKSAADRMSWHGPEDFVSLAATGLNSIRLLVVWAALMPEEGKIEQAYLDALGERVDWAHEAGLLVILDMHQDLFGYGFGGNGAPLWACPEEKYAAYQPTTPWWRNYTSPPVKECFDRFYGSDDVFAHFRDAWSAVGARFAEHPAVVGFDLLNEPNWGNHDMAAFVPEVWQPRMEQLAAALREEAPARIVFFQGMAMAGLAYVDDFVPAADPRTAFAPHYYHPLLHEGVPYNQTHFPQLVAGFDAIAEMAVLLGEVPVWLGEFGVHTQVPSQLDYLDDTLVELARRRWSWAYWADDRADSGFSLRSADGSVKPELLLRLGHAYARRVPGPLLEQSLDRSGRAYSARFRWTHDAPLELWTGPVGEDESRPAPAVENEGDGAASCEPVAALNGLWLCEPPAMGAGLGEEWTIRLE
jgi:endoglycosylceramidase